MWKMMAYAAVASWITMSAIHGAYYVDDTTKSLFVVSETAREFVLTTVIDAEINATRKYIELLHTKAALLERMIEIEQANVNATFIEEAKSSKPWHHQISKPSNERFDDWLTPQGTWYSPPAVPGSSTNEFLHVELLSFRSHGAPGGKRHNHASRSKLHDPTAPIVQFLMMLDKQSGMLELFHPMTKVLLWQQALEISAPITRVYFHSDRASHLVLATENNRLLVYKMRVYHGRRLAAGDYRRQSGKETMTCNARVSLPLTENDSIVGTCPSINPFSTIPTHRTNAPFGLHTHFEIEFDFARTYPGNLSQFAMTASYHSLVVLTSSDDGQIAFFDAHNGSFVGDLETNLGRITHFQPLSSGVVALAVNNRIHFVDAIDRRLLDLTCEGSRHIITSLERDVWRHTILYAGTSGGQGLAFRINRYGSIKRDDGQVPLNADAMDPSDNTDFGFPTCTLTALLQPRARYFSKTMNKTPVQPAIVTTLPGHVLLSTGDGHLVLYDTASRPGFPVYLTEKTLASTFQNVSTIVSGAYAGKDLHAPSAAVTIVIHEYNPDLCVRVELFASRLPSVSSGIDIGWLRAPIMLLCAFGVMFWQQNRFRQPTPSLADFDLPGVARHRRQYGRSGHSDWSRPANHRAFSGR